MNEIKGSGPRVELIGNRVVNIDGCDGVIDYSDERVSFRLGRMTVHISGKNLLLKVMTENSAVIEGFVHSVEYTY